MKNSREGAQGRQRGSDEQMPWCHSLLRLSTHEEFCWIVTRVLDFNYFSLQRLLDAASADSCPILLKVLQVLWGKLPNLKPKEMLPVIVDNTQLTQGSLLEQCTGFSQALSQIGPIQRTSGIIQVRFRKPLITMGQVRWSRAIHGC